LYDALVPSARLRSEPFLTRRVHGARLDLLRADAVFFSVTAA
jgi:hypothetical protein